MRSAARVATPPVFAGTSVFLAPLSRVRRNPFVTRPGARNTTCNGNASYFVLSLELIF